MRAPGRTVAHDRNLGLFTMEKVASGIPSRATQPKSISGWPPVEGSQLAAIVNGSPGLGAASRWADLPGCRGCHVGKQKYAID